MVAILALSAIGVGMRSARILPEDVYIFFVSMLLQSYNYFNLNILLMALHEHPTFYYWPTPTSIRLMLSFHPISLQSACAVALDMI